MKSKWKVSSNTVNGRTVYQVFRIRDTSQVHHSGNRDEHGKAFANREEAEVLAEQLNNKEE